MKYFIFGILFLFVFGCVQNNSERNSAVEKCIQLCRSLISNNADIYFGPCLSNEIEKDWVCDVAHSPRIASDNLAENQCSFFREGKAGHFVELDTDCSMIKTS